MSKSYQDNYRGYYIDFNPSHEGYWILKEPGDEKPMFVRPTFDECCNQIDAFKKDQGKT